MGITRIAGPLIMEDGKLGVFTREEADGALPNGTIVRKVNNEPGDTTPEGTLGVVIGSLPNVPDPDPEFADVRCAYFIEWQDKPNLIVGTMDRKVEEVT